MAQSFYYFPGGDGFVFEPDLYGWNASVACSPCVFTPLHERVPDKRPSWRAAAISITFCFSTMRMSVAIMKSHIEELRKLP